MVHWVFTAAAPPPWLSSCHLWGPTSSQVGVGVEHILAVVSVGVDTIVAVVVFSLVVVRGTSTEHMGASIEQAAVRSLVKGAADATLINKTTSTQRSPQLADALHSVHCQTLGHNNQIAFYMQVLLLCACSWTPTTCVRGRAALVHTRLAATMLPQSCHRWQQWLSTSAARCVVLCVLCECVHEGEKDNSLLD